MAKIRLKGPVGGISGTIDGVVFADNGLRTIAYVKKPRTSEKSEAEQRRDDRMAEARAYATTVKAENPELWAFYKKVGKPKKITPRAIAIKDFMNVPFFRPLDLSNYKGQVGDPIKIHCVDDIGLVSVEVSIDRQDGSDVEKGMAEKDLMGEVVKRI